MLYIYMQKYVYTCVCVCVCTSIYLSIYIDGAEKINPEHRRVHRFRAHGTAAVSYTKQNRNEPNRNQTGVLMQRGTREGNGVEHGKQSCPNLNVNPKP
jgi:hypothetical protein